MPVPLDEYPIHQAPQSMKWFATSDRNAYDRCIMHALSPDGATQIAVGLGVYPHVGVIDCYIAIRQGHRLTSLRTSGVLGDDRMVQQVGSMRIEVLEGLKTVRFVCEEDEGISADLTWHGSFPAVDEPRHIKKAQDVTILDAFRFVQTATVTGQVVVDGQILDATTEGWVGARDRSWGIRPVGEATAAGRPTPDGYGMWWCWIPLRFETFALMLVLEESPDGYRTINEAIRIRPDGSIEQLGWAETDIRYTSGTRYPTGATISLRGRDGRDLDLEIETMGPMPLSVGLGYGPDDDGWNHGRWMGESWTQRVDHQLDAEPAATRMAWSMIDHAARASFDGEVGFGIFEHLCLGPHAPSGFADITSMAP